MTIRERWGVRVCRLLLGVGLAGIAISMDVAWGVEDAILLKESSKDGETTRVSVSLEASGLLRPEDGEGKASGESKVKVRTRVEYVERRLPCSGPILGRALRRVESASATVEGDESVRSTSQTLRPSVSWVVAERTSGGLTVASPLGPLTRSELELVQVPADPLELGALLAPGPIGLGGHWPIPDAAALSLAGYDRIEANALQGRLVSFDEKSARIEIEGEVAGEHLGARGRTTVSASLLLDRSASRVTDLTLRRGENRRAGPVEPGVEMQSTLRVSRKGGADVGPVVSSVSEAIAGLASDQPMPGAWMDLLLIAPGDRFAIRHDRSWYLVGEDDRQVVVRRLERGGSSVQLNLINGPLLKPGERPDPQGFRNEVREALGKRFRRFLDAGQVAGAEPGGSCYRVAVEGDQDGTPIRWIYFRLLGARGEQQVATFTLRSDRAASFGDEDLRLMRSFSWGPGAMKPEETPPSGKP